MHKLSDQELSFKVAAYQDSDAFAELYQRYFALLQKFIYFRISAKEDAEDLANQVFLDVWEYLTTKGVKETWNTRAFLYKVTRNQIANFYRAKGRTPFQVELDKVGEYGDYLDIADERADLLQSYLSNQDKDRVIEAVQKLPEPYREVIALKFFEELHIQEIAEVIGKSEGNIRVIIYRGKQMLKNIIKTP